MGNEVFLRFKVKCSDDDVWDQAGNLLIPGGRKTGAMLCEVFKCHGLACSEPIQHSFYGWRFYANKDTLALVALFKAAVWVQIRGWSSWNTRKA